MSLFSTDIHIYKLLLLLIKLFASQAIIELDKVINNENEQTCFCIRKKNDKFIYLTNGNVFSFIGHKQQTKYIMVL